MNTIKFHDYDTNSNPTSVKLTYKDGKSEVLSFFPYSRYYDKFDKAYRSFKTFSKINGRNYI